MLTSRNLVSSLGAAFALLCAVSACGGGGGSGGGGTTPGGPPTISPPLSASGNLQIAGTPVANGFVVYSCGCSAQAGSVATDSGGNFLIPASAAATPSAPNPTYTLGPDRNYVVVGSRSSSAGSSTEAWTMDFVAQRSANNLSLNATNTGNTSDAYTAAGTLYIYYFTQRNGSGDLAFDQWNFNQVLSWVNTLKSPSATTPEKNLITDITAAQQSNISLFPKPPTWNTTQPNPNAIIAADLRAVQSQVPTDPTLPTPCPASGCTGAPGP